jgi:hypothetical protein
MLWAGRLLNEAKDLLKHGEWNSWLRRHTALSTRTAQRYMRAATWADAKNDTVSHLDLEHLSPKAIYLLASGRFDDETVKRVLDAATAATRHINESDVNEIARKGDRASILRGIAADQKAEAEAKAAHLRSLAEADAARQLELAKAEGFETVEAWEAAIQVERAKREAAWEAQQAKERAALEAILDGGPDPDLPPPPEPVAASSETFHVATLERSVDMLRSVMTKPLSPFASAKLSPSDIKQVAAFLLAVAEQIAGKQRAA